MKKNLRPLCPDHHCPFEARHGRFGVFYGCPHYPACDKIARKSGHTGQWSVSGQAIRDARKKAHAAFDGIWQDGRLKRSKAYRALAALMNMHPRDCHIEHFDEAQCATVVALVCDGAIERRHAEHEKEKATSQ